MTARSIKKQIKRRRRRAIHQAACMAGLMAIIVIGLRMATDCLHIYTNAQKQKTSRTHLQAASSAIAEPPVERHPSQITADLKINAGTSALAAEIYENRNKYPETLLFAYLNNPEMEEFVAGYLDAHPATMQGIPDSSENILTMDELSQDYPLFLQWDKRWGYAPYGSSVIGLSGCGPTCLSMVLFSLKEDPAMTPIQVAAFSEENGYYVEGSGTAWSLMTDGAAQLGLSAKELSLDESVMKAALDAGNPIICSMGPGDFTTQGHFIMIYGYDEDGFWVNDPNCIARSSQPWTFERLRGQIKNLWAYSL